MDRNQFPAIVQFRPYFIVLKLALRCYGQIHFNVTIPGAKIEVRRNVLGNLQPDIAVAPPHTITTDTNTWL